MEETQLEKIQQFRTQLCNCFIKRAAASFNLIDALAAAAQVESPIGLSESPAFKRKYASVYDVLDENALDQDKLNKLLHEWKVDDAQTIAGYQVYASDSTGNPRPEADCLPDRILLKSDKKQLPCPGKNTRASHGSYVTNPHGWPQWICNACPVNRLPVRSRRNK